MYLTNVAPYTVRYLSKRSTHDPSPLGVLTPVPLSGRSSPPCPPLRSGEGGPMSFPLSRRERGQGGEDRTVRRPGVEEQGSPPPTAPTTRTASAPDATAAGWA